MLSGVRKGQTVSINFYWDHSTSATSTTRSGTVSIVGYYDSTK